METLKKYVIYLINRFSNRLEGVSHWFNQLEQAVNQLGSLF